MSDLIVKLAHYYNAHAGKCWHSSLEMCSEFWKWGVARGVLGRNSSVNALNWA